MFMKMVSTAPHLVYSLYLSMGAVDEKSFVPHIQIQIICSYD